MLSGTLNIITSKHRDSSTTKATKALNQSFMQNCIYSILVNLLFSLLPPLSHYSMADSLFIQWNFINSNIPFHFFRLKLESYPSSQFSAWFLGCFSTSALVFDCFNCTKCSLESSVPLKQVYLNNTTSLSHTHTHTHTHTLTHVFAYCLCCSVPSIVV